MKPLRISFLVFLLAIYAFFLASHVNLSVSDLGRHLKNGELFLKSLYIPGVNLYSYTYPDFPFVNHHWGSGAIFFAVQRLSGFKGLSLFFIAVSLLTFLVFFRLSRRYSGFWITAFASLFCIPNLISRLEIRPEIFSYFFSGIFFWILLDHRNGRLKSKWIFLLPILELAWVNLHIYFFIGLMLIGFFLAEKSSKKLAAVLGLSMLAACINPSGLRGALYPLNIFRNYSLNVFENISFIELSGLMKREAFDFHPLFYFKLSFALLALSWLFIFIRSAKERKAFSPALLLISVFFSLMAFLALRNYSLFAYFALPVTSINLSIIIKRRFGSYQERAALAALFLLVAFNLFAAKPAYWLRGKALAIGLRQDDGRPVDFFNREQIQGPILNGFDLGSYLIYYLYPGQRVFVDNRPEAYPADFFRNVYTPLQQSEDSWRKADARYRFNAIIFNPHVDTPWGQDFLKRRILDPLWAAVYVDGSCIIILRKDGPNAGVAEKYSLPLDMFFPQQEKMTAQ